MNGSTRLLLTILSGLLVMPIAVADGGPWWEGKVSGADGLEPVARGDITAGWNLRIPLRVENPGPAILPGHTLAQAHLDLGTALVQGGWPSSLVAGLVTPRGFTVDPDSLRVLPAGTDWTALTGAAPLASVVTLGWLDADQSTGAFARIQDSPFDPSRNSLLTLEWRIGTPIAPGATGFFNAYFDILENHDIAGHALAKSDPGLDSLYWMGTGTTLYGYHPGQATVEVTGQPRTLETLMVLGLEDATHVRIFTYPGGFDAEQADEFSLGKDQVKRVALGPSPTPVRIESNRPVLAIQHDRRLEAGADFIPGIDGRLATSKFVVPALTERALVIVPPQAPVTEVCVGRTPAATTCTAVAPGRFHTVILRSDDLRNVDPTALTYVSAQVQENGGTKPGTVLMQWAPVPGGGEQQAVSLAQVPTFQGAPVGTRFAASTLAQASGRIVLEGQEPATVRISKDGVRLGGGDLEVPAGGQAVLFGAEIPAGPERSANPPRYYSHALDISVLAGGGVRALVGSKGPDDTPTQSTAYGGTLARSFFGRGPFVAFPFYDVTVATLTLGTRVEALAGDAGTPISIDVGKDTAWTLQSDKPMAVLPLGDPERFVRPLPAKPDVAPAKPSPGEYRGYLLDIRPTQGEDPLFLQGLPGDVLEVPFQVTNLGRWSDGAVLEDTATLQVDAPDDWAGAVVVDRASMDLIDGEPVEGIASITVPFDVNGLTALKVGAVSKGNPNMASEFTVLVSVGNRFGVDAWFGNHALANGPDSLPPQRIQVGETKEWLVAVRNTGTAEDYVLHTTPALTGGWGVTLLAGSSGSTEADPLIGPLAAGQSTPLRIQVRAPSNDAVPVATVVLEFVSQESPEATATLTLPVRIRLGQGIELSGADELARLAPGGTHRFMAHLANTGQDGVSLLLSLAEDLPFGWTARFEGLGDPERGPLALLPGQAVDIPILVTATPDAPAGALATVLLRADGIGTATQARDALPLLAQVDAVHAIVLEAPGPQAFIPGQRTEVAFEVSNQGNGPETLRILARQLPGNWRLEAGQDLTLARGQTAVIAFNVTSPTQAAAGPTTLHLTLASVQGVRQDIALQATVAQAPALNLTATEWPSMARAGETIHATFLVRNDGNVPLETTFNLGLPPGWKVATPPAPRTLQPGALAELPLLLRVAEGAPGPATVTLAASTASGATVQAHLDIDVKAQGLQLLDAEVLSTGDPAAPIRLLSATFHNPLDTSIPGVLVQVWEGPRVAANLTFQSIGPNATASAVLRWAVQNPSGPLRLTWHAHGDPNPLGEEILVAPLDSTHETPWPLPWAALAVALVVRLVRRRP